MTNKNGQPYDDRFGEGSMLENGGDVVEALEKCYGMVWWLAERSAQYSNDSMPVSRQQILAEIEFARLNYRAGVATGKNFGIT